MFTQKEDHLQEGNMLIHSWYRLGRGTPHRPMSGVTCHPRQRWNERLAGNYRKPWPPRPGNPEISNPQLFLHESLWDRGSEKAVLTFQFITLFQKQGTFTPPLPHPCQATEKGTPPLPFFSISFPPAAASQAWTAVCTPTSAQWVQKDPEMMSKILKVLQHTSDYSDPFLF